MFTKGEQCSERVSDGGRWPHYYRCTKKAVVERDAKHYCKVHDPEYIKAKRQAQGDKWDAERKKRDDGYKRESLAREIFQDIATDTIEANKAKYKSAPGMYEALKVVVDYFDSYDMSNASEFLPQIRKALSKAESKK